MRLIIQITMLCFWLQNVTIHLNSIQRLNNNCGRISWQLFNKMCHRFIKFDAKSWFETVCFLSNNRQWLTTRPIHIYINRYDEINNMYVDEHDVYFNDYMTIYTPRRKSGEHIAIGISIRSPFCPFVWPSPQHYSSRTACSSSILGGHAHRGRPLDKFENGRPWCIFQGHDNPK